MINLFRQLWWKLLAIPVLIYVLVSGLTTPLGPGITGVSPSSTSRGSMIGVDIYGYNTHFDPEDDAVDVILKNADNLICANEVTVINKRFINAEFGLPQDLFISGNAEAFNVIVHNEQDGTFFLRGGFTVTRNDSVKGVRFKCATNFPVELTKNKVFPYREILYESIRNLYFHVPMWFTMITLMLFSFICSIAFLATNKEAYDIYASRAAGVGIFFGMLGILTGMQWASMTWGAPWVNDPKLNGAAVGLLIYLAYFVLRGSLEDELKRAKVSAVYGIFSFVIFIVFIWVIPRMTDSLHPGSGGNPGFNMYDLDNTMRPVFYSAVIGFIILGFWLLSLVTRYKFITNKLESKS